MDKCAHPLCTCSDVQFEQEQQKFCSATCADASAAHDLADAMCACAHDSCSKD